MNMLYPSHQIVNASTPLAKGDSVSSGLASGDSFDCDQVITSQCYIIIMHVHSKKQLKLNHSNNDKLELTNE